MKIRPDAYPLCYDANELFGKMIFSYVQNTGSQKSHFPSGTEYNNGYVLNLYNTYETQILFVYAIKKVYVRHKDTIEIGEWYALN